MKHILFLFISVVFFACNTQVNQHNQISDYKTLKDTLARGWNTWDNRSVMTHVLLPEGLAVILQLQDSITGDTLEHAFIGNRVEGKEKVQVIAHTPGGEYTALYLEWRDFGVKISSSASDEILNIKIEPDMNKSNPGFLNVKTQMFYGKEGKTGLMGDHICGELPGKRIKVNVLADDIRFEDTSGKIKIPLTETIGITTNETGTIESISETVKASATKYESQMASFGEESETWNAIQNSLYWNVVYDPFNDRALTPVARTWAYGWGNSKPGGWVLFCWDNYFAAWMHAIESKEYAFNEAILMTHIIDELGFVPNYYGPYDIKSGDRSQPPVGSMMINEIYKVYPEQWFLEEVYDRLMVWNRWWDENRNWDGYLCWGSDEWDPGKADKRMETQHNFPAASNESGLDNTPMYDGIPFDEEKNMIAMADVGLMSLYIGDCDALIEMGEILGKDEEIKELKQRREFYAEKLKSLWSEEEGLYLNKNMYTGELSNRISPTNFYPFIAKVPTPEQAKRMIEEHLMNPEEFWGDYVLPSISRNDTAYTGKDYWRGSIWAPMNFLVYYGMRNYDLPEARKALADKSNELMLKEWEKDRFVRENYDAETGTHPGDRSENFYHWGALLGMTKMMEEGLVD